MARFVILIHPLFSKAYVSSWFFSPLRLQNIISQKKAESKEGKDEPSKDNQQQALIDQRYFQVLLTKRLMFIVNLSQKSQ